MILIPSVIIVVIVPTAVVSDEEAILRLYRMQNRRRTHFIEAVFYADQRFFIFFSLSGSLMLHPQLKIFGAKSVLLLDNSRLLPQALQCPPKNEAAG